MRITEEGYNYALFMTRRQVLQRKCVGFFQFSFLFFFFSPVVPQPKNLKIDVVLGLLVLGLSILFY